MSIELTLCPGCKLFVSLRGYDHHIMWCDGAGRATEVHLGILDDMDHEAKYDTDAEYRKSELRIQALGAAISRKDWYATEQAYAAIRDKFYSHSAVTQDKRQ